MSTIAMYPDQVNDAWQGGPTSQASTVDALKGILLNGLGRFVDQEITNRYAPRDPQLSGLAAGGLYGYTQGQPAGGVLAGGMASPLVPLLLIGGAVVLVVLLVK